MATQTSVRLVDDLDGSPADEVISISWGNAEYEIDLNETHAAQLREALAPYIAAARHVGRGGRPTAPPRRSPARGRDETADIRRWAREHGHEVSERGRISSTVLAAWANRHNAPVTPPVDAAVSVPEEKPKRARRPRKAKEKASTPS
jgi:Lsr2